MRTWKLLAVLLSLLGCGCVGFVTVRPRETGEKVASTTPDELLSTSGAPDEKRIVDGDEVWTYQEDRRWAGIVLFPVVPLPLLLPVAHDRVDYRFRGDTLVDSNVWKVETRSALCGLAMGPCSVPGCYFDH